MAKKMILIIGMLFVFSGVRVRGMDLSLELDRAIRAQDIDKFKGLMIKVVDPNAEISLTGNLFYSACRDLTFFGDNKTDIIKYLMSRKDVDVNKYNTKYKETPLQRCCRLGYLGLVKTLIETGKFNINDELMKSAQENDWHPDVKEYLEQQKSLKEVTSKKCDLMEIDKKN